MRNIIFSLGFLCISTYATATPQHITLKNGLQIYVIERPQSPVVLTSVWYKVGSSYEYNGITGVSHYLEHMLFRGTKKYPGDMFEKLIYQNAGSSNAFTTYDFTTYHEELPADKLDLSLKLEADRMKNIVLSEQLLAREKKVIMEERRMRVEDKPESLLYERMMAAANITNPYHHPIIGWMNDILNLQLNDLMDWYHTYYAPNNAVLIVAGDVNAANVFSKARKYFTNIPTSKIPKSKDRIEVANLGPKKIIVNTYAKKPLLYLAFPAPNLNANKKEAYSLLLLSGLLDINNTGYLIDNLVRGKQVASYVFSSYDPNRLYSTLFIIGAAPNDNSSIDTLEQDIYATINKISSDGVDQKFLDQVKAQIIAQYVYDQDDLMGASMKIGEPLMLNQPILSLAQFKKIINGITPIDIETVAKEILRRDVATTAILMPKQNTEKGIL